MLQRPGAEARPAALHRPRGRARVLLLLAPALVCFGLSAYLSLRQPLFVGGDERAHLLYVASVIDGRLPEFDNDFGAADRLPVVRRSLEGTAKGTDIDGVWVAYHPPLPYVLAAPPVWLASELGPDTWPALTMRLVNAAATATGVVFVGLFAAELSPGRRRVGFAAACLTAVVANLVAVGSGGLNDGAGFAVAAASWFVAARLLRCGPTARALTAACVAASGAMLTRISLGPIAAMLAGAACVSVWRHRPDRGVTWVAARRAVGAGLLVGGTALVTSGWFYWRNHQLYGRLTAPEAPPELARVRPSPGPVEELLTGTAFHRRIWSALYGTVSGPLAYVHAERLVTALAVLLVLAAAVAALRRHRSGRAVARTDGRDGAEAPVVLTDGIGAFGWVLVGGCCAAIIVGTADFVSAGGAPHPRYLFPVLPVASALLARAIDELPLPRLVLTGVVGSLAAITVTQLARVPELIETLPLVAPFDRSAVGPAWPRLALGLALAAALASAWIGWRGGDTRPAPPPAATQPVAGGLYRSSTSSTSAVDGVHATVPESRSSRTAATGSGSEKNRSSP